MMLNPELVGKAHYFHPERTQRAHQERMQYIDGTFTYMCGAPIFEFGLWPYLPHIAVMGLSTIFLVLYKYSIQSDLPLVTAYLVLGMGFVLGLLIIVGLCVGASRNIEDFSRRKAQRKKQVLQVEGDENRRGYTMADQSRFPGGMDSMATTTRRRGLNVETSSAIMESDSVGEARGEWVDEEDLLPLETEGRHDLTHSNPEYMQKQYRAITRAATSKIVEASFMMTITFSWLVYGTLFSSFGRDLFPISIDISLAVFGFALTQTSYVQAWYDNIIIRYITFMVWAAVLFLDPTTNGNVPSCEDASLLSLLLRLVLFFVIYCLAEADTTAQINYWLRFCNQKKLIRNLPKLVSPPIEQIDTPGNRRIYAIQRIAFQSMYVLYLPFMVWPFAVLHMVWLVYRIRITIAENNEGMMKKYEDISMDFTRDWEDSESMERVPPSQDRELIVLEDTETFSEPESMAYGSERRRMSHLSTATTHLSPLPHHHHQPSAEHRAPPEFPGSQGRMMHGGLIPTATPAPLYSFSEAQGSEPFEERPRGPALLPPPPEERNPAVHPPPPTFRPRGPPLTHPGRMAAARKVRYIRVRGSPPRGATRVPHGFVPVIPGRGIPSATVPSSRAIHGRSPYPPSSSYGRGFREAPSTSGGRPFPSGVEELHSFDREEYSVGMGEEGDV